MAVDAPGDGAPSPRIALIAAVAANGVIGAEGGMPWHLPADMRHFKQTTTGHPVIMGRRTYESIAGDVGGPLPGRTNVVLSRSDPDLPGEGGDVVVADSVDEALDAARDAAVDRGVDTVYVAGGGAVYEQFLPLADRLVLTEVHESYDGDTVFPEFDRDEWVERERDEREAFDFVVYERSE
ncbi:dihydrofolate reductase [Halobaculum sp. CBA1158]|uniref:dihydrofolate reductase n=1 Tax=Halobaculum sp. CBA1158 TaxID=2904243 RepID=UPI001F356D41|nr:dihydrofolate reductase [Halobaculum sp. CBA1158]UIO98792.1 dihydrofolate reductase [Halobaculum sp. CBA1158]